MDLTLSEQRKDIDEAIRYFDSKILELTHNRQVLINAFNSIDSNKEDILKSNSILAQESRKIMCGVNYKDLNKSF